MTYALAHVGDSDTQELRRARLARSHNWPGRRSGAGFGAVGLGPGGEGNGYAVSCYRSRRTEAGDGARKRAGQTGVVGRADRLPHIRACTSEQ